MPELAQQVFTIEAANALVPRLSMMVGEQLLRRAEIEAMVKQLGDVSGETPESLNPLPGDSTDIHELKREILTRVEEYQRGWGDVEALGAVLKDPRIGLLDFYGHVDGRLVWLCWKYGETEIRHYHGLDEGYSGRKEIKPPMKNRHLN
jgi:hypothetical protein